MSRGIAKIKKRRGAPTKYNIEDIIGKLSSYIEKTDLPVIARFCANYPIPREYLYQLASLNEELSYTIRRGIEKKEAELEEGGLTGKYQPTMSIFSLKQLGWKDTQTIENPEALKEIEKLRTEIKQWLNV